MPKDFLQSSCRDSLLDASDREGMSQHMGRDRSPDVGAIGYLLDHALDRPDTDLHSVVQSQMTLKEGLHPRRERDDSPFRQFPIRATLAVDHEPMVLPVQVLPG